MPAKAASRGPRHSCACCRGSQPGRWCGAGVGSCDGLQTHGTELWEWRGPRGRRSWHPRRRTHRACRASWTEPMHGTEVGTETLVRSAMPPTLAALLQKAIARPQPHQFTGGEGVERRGERVCSVAEGLRGELGPGATEAGGVRNAGAGAYGGCATHWWRATGSVRLGCCAGSPRRPAPGAPLQLVWESRCCTPPLPAVPCVCGDDMPAASCNAACAPMTASLRCSATSRRRSATR